VNSTALEIQRTAGEGAEPLAQAAASHPTPQHAAETEGVSNRLAVTVWC